MIKVEGHSNLRRDPKSNSIVNVDMEAFKNYQMQVNKIKNQEKRIDKLEEKLDKITDLLSDLLNKNN
jgi:hypothetical protein